MKQEEETLYSTFEALQEHKKHHHHQEASWQSLETLWEGEAQKPGRTPYYPPAIPHTLKRVL